MARQRAPPSESDLVAVVHALRRTGPRRGLRRDLNRTVRRERASRFRRSCQDWATRPANPRAPIGHDCLSRAVECMEGAGHRGRMLGITGNPIVCATKPCRGASTRSAPSCIECSTTRTPSRRSSSAGGAKETPDSSFRSDSQGETSVLRAHVVVNRRARRLVAPGRLYDEILRPRPGVEIIETNSLDDLDAVARTLKSRGRDSAVVFAGGDGSHMAGVSALARAFGDELLPPIALAPGGTVGTVARNWGMSGDPVRWTARLLDAIAAGTIRSTPRPTLRVREEGAARVLSRRERVDLERGGSEPVAFERTTFERVGFIFGAGLIARFFDLYKARGAGGNLAAARIVARIFVASIVDSRLARSVLDPTPCKIELDGVPAPFDRMSLACAGVVRDLGLKMRLLYRASEELDRFHAVATDLGPRALRAHLPRVLAGRPLLGPRVDALVKELRLHFPEQLGAYVLDGDLFRADGITVTAGPVLDVLY
jgi:diacylglycerol kinase (ATP)